MSLADAAPQPEVALGALGCAALVCLFAVSERLLGRGDKRPADAAGRRRDDRVGDVGEPTPIGQGIAGIGLGREQPDRRADPLDRGVHSRGPVGEGQVQAPAVREILLRHGADEVVAQLAAVRDGDKPLLPFLARPISGVGLRRARGGHDPARRLQDLLPLIAREFAAHRHVKPPGSLDNASVSG